MMKNKMLHQYEIIRGYPSNYSASDTDIWEARDLRTGKPVIFKVFIADYTIQTGKRKKTITNPNTELLLHEIRVYEFLKKKLIYPKNVRNIVCIQANFSFTQEDLAEALQKPRLNLSGETIAGNIMRNFKYLVLAVSEDENRQSITATLPFSEKDYLDYQTDLSLRKGIAYDKVVFQYDCIVTPKIKSFTFSEFVQFERISLSEFARYIFIISCTLYLLSSCGINQNDTHWRNILLDNTYFGPSSYHKRDYFLVYKDYVLYIDNTYVPFILDFDRAAIQGRIIKRMVSDKSYVSAGNCPKFHPKRDFLRMMCSIYYYLTKYHSNLPGKDAFLREMMTTLIHSELIRKTFRIGVYTKDACKMSGDRAYSLLCKSNVLKDVSSPDEFLDWFLSKTDYMYFNWKEVISGTYSARSTELLGKFCRSLPQGSNQVRQSILANVQFIQDKSEGDQARFVDYILNFHMKRQSEACRIL
jgi:hypothetical protein